MLISSEPFFHPYLAPTLHELPWKPDICHILRVLTENASVALGKMSGHSRNQASLFKAATVALQRKLFGVIILRTLHSQAESTYILMLN